MAPAAADDERVEFRGLPVRDEFRGLSRGRPFRGAVPNHSTQPKGSQQAAPSCLSPAITELWANPSPKSLLPRTTHPAYPKQRAPDAGAASTAQV